MIFDQYSRYKACSDLLRQTGFVAGNSVLDIGSGPECLFGQFMPDAVMNYVDPLITIDAGQRHIMGDVFSCELDGQVFDCVTAVDVLEHVSSEHRQEFLQRASSLARNTLILGFPTSDTSAAQEIDKELDDRYRVIFSHDYSWLLEHYRFGLPSLSDTVNQLNKLGWHCQSVGHGYAPWLKELLGFVICIWDIPSLKQIVLDISEKFNHELYQYDFRAPYYREFIIASRTPLAPISIHTEEKSAPDAEEIFQTLIADAYRQYFVASMKQLTDQADAFGQRDEAVRACEAAVEERDVAIVERDAALEVRDAAIVECDAAQVERDAALEVRDVAIEERDAAIEERDAVANMFQNTSSWRITQPMRFIARLYRYGLLTEDRQRLTLAMRKGYHQMSLPKSVKKIVRFAYYRIFGKTVRTIHRSALQITKFHFPSNRSTAQHQSKPDYIVWGVIDWHFRHQRPQQFALELVNSGRRVFYISPNLIDDDRAGFEVETLDTNGLLFQVKLFTKGAPVIYLSVPSLEATTQLRASIGEVLHWADSKQLVSLVHHPFWCDVASVLPNSRLVYDCMDHHEGFGNTGESLMHLEKVLLCKSDLTIITSNWLDQAVAEHTQRRALIRNAAEYQHFSQAPETIYRDPRGRRIIGYYGAIAEWFDLDLVEEVAKQNSECCILLIGADTINAISRLGMNSNVIFTGEVPYNKLPYYLYSFDVCLLPFKIIPLTIATNPVKVYEYLSAGKPIVSVDLPEMAQFDGLIEVAADKKQFLAAIDSVLMQSESDDLVRRRKDFAAGQTWKHRTETLIKQAEYIDNDPLVSVILLTYNNIELTRACLTSIKDNSQYANIEIIIVDNASRDGSQEFLMDWAASNKNCKLILNEKNRGFAAGNNQGLAAATGDYLVILNNDTYVTPGWVRTLLQHLRRDKTIGLIGPVTNNIGNEAKIDITYNDMDDMLIKSAAYTRRHIGETYPLRTAAFFCVMMSREVFEQVGPLDEAFGRGFFEDDDYCRRIEKIGLRIVCAEDVFIHHHLSASFNKLNVRERQKLFEENLKIYEAKWGKWFPHSYRGSD